MASGSRQWVRKSAGRFAIIRPMHEDVPTPQSTPESSLPIGRWVRNLLRHGLRVTAAVPAMSSSPLPKIQEMTPGAAPGIEHHELTRRPGAVTPVVVTCTDYSADRVQVEQVADVADFIARHRPTWSTVRWINIDGLTDMDVVRPLAEKYGLHPLAIEDVIQIPQRPKAEDYPGSGDHQARLFVIARMLELVDGHLHSEQISFFLGRKTLLTFQEDQGDVWDPIRQRIGAKGSRLRQNDVSFLLYALLDAIIDQCFPILEFYSDQLEDMEDLVLTSGGTETIQRIHALKRELLILRRSIWPMREVINSLQREPHECMSDVTRTYLRDVYDNCVQIIDLVETYREFATGLTETYMSALSIRMNEIMKVLTIMGTIFIPLTFLAGVYGMNMPIPENQTKWAYPVFWLVCLGTAAGMLLWFKRRRWL
jgi:magnesium transporter